MAEAMADREIPPGKGICPVCGGVYRVTAERISEDDYGWTTHPPAMFNHGPRGNRCPGSGKRPSARRTISP